MPKYIKSHSNYRLNSVHQVVKNGKILERDISTIGGVDSFATGQSTIYSSGNFIITTNNTPSPSRHIIKKDWLANSESGDTWNTDVLQNYTSDINGSVESKINLNNDFVDLRSFACYGSLYDLIQTSISKIIDKFPYEIYTGSGTEIFEKHYFSANVKGMSFDYKGNVNPGEYTVTTNFFELTDSGTPVSYVETSHGKFYEISNPGYLDLHTKFIDSTVINNPLKYFANGGFLNYSIFSEYTTETPIDGYDFDWDVDDNVYNVSGTTVTIPPKKDFIVSNFTLNIQKDVTLNNINFNGKDYAVDSISLYAGDVIYGKIKNDTLVLSKKYCPEEGDYVATVTLSVKLEFDTTRTLKIYAFRNQDLNVVYLVKEDDLFFHIRPRPSLCAYDDFIDNASLFERCLLGVYSNNKNVAKFEILHENESGTYSQLEEFTFPTGPGGYNIATNDDSIELYIRQLAQIGLEYDEKYTDNMYRLMTHEALKNFDWTKDFNGNGGDLDNDYVTNGDKLKSIIRIMGYVFDKEKTYIDCIGSTNVVTYNNRANLPEYFFTDALELDGWDIQPIYPYNLRQYNQKTNKEVNPIDWSDINQKNNYFRRKFFENTTDIIKPYTKDEGGFYMTCEKLRPIIKPVPNYSGQTYYVDHGTVKNVIRDYVKPTEYTIPDVNNEFMRRLKINSRSLLSKKGTIEGIESLLSLFGFKSKRWFTALNTKRTNYKFDRKFTANLTKKLPFDYDIVEYTMFTPPIKEGWDEPRNMYKIDFYNHCKTIPYNTPSALRGEYIPYQGIPVAYRDIDGLWIGPSGETTDRSSAYTDSDFNEVNARRLYPYFENDGAYDGDMYYQMNGGWLNYWPYSFDVNDNILPNYDSSICTETLRALRQVKNLHELVSQPLSYLYDGAFFYVTDLTTNYAIINGIIYELYDEFIDDKHYMYFKVPIYAGTVSIGGELYNDYIRVSDKTTEDGTTVYDLSLYEDGVEIKIYYNNEEEPFIIEQIMSLINETVMLEPNDMQVFMNGSLYNQPDKATHYFQLSNASFADTISDWGWYQLQNDNPLYLRLNSIIDKFNGNNPHSGNFVYDNGFEYISRFNKLFKYAYLNKLFDESCFYDVDTAYQEISTIGFSGLTSINDYDKDYSQFLHPDSKIHSFADVINISGQTRHYDISNSEWIKSIPDYEFVKDIPEADGVTSQIMNTKVIEIKFYLSKEEFFSKEYQEEMKFIQNKVIPYLEQMLPSTAIVKIKLYPAAFNWVFNKDDNDPTDFGKVDRWKDYYFWREEAKLGEQFDDYNRYLDFE